MKKFFRGLMSIVIAGVIVMLAAVTIDSSASAGDVVQNLMNYTMIGYFVALFALLQLINVGRDVRMLTEEVETLKESKKENNETT